MSEPIRDAETAVRELGALPVPVGTAPVASEGRARTMLDHAREALRARMSKDALRLVLENTITYAASLEERASRYRIAWRAARTRAISTSGAADRYAARARDAQEALQHMLFTVIAGQMALKAATDEAAQLRARVAELETDLAAKAQDAEAAVKGWERARDRVAELEAQTKALRAPHVKHADSEHCQHDGERWPCPTVAALGDDERPADEDPIRYTLTEQAPVTIYRAEHPDSGITLGHYGTEKAARAHCEATERRSWPTGTTLSFDWIRDALPEDDENGIAELVVTAGQNEESTTGYIVTALEVPSVYDDEADE